MTNNPGANNPPPNTNHFDPEAIRLAREYIAYQAANPDIIRDFHNLLANPGNLPPQAAPQSAPTDPWQAFTLADAYLDRPPTEYIAGNAFALPSLNIVYGAPGTMKSLVLVDLAICVAGGFDWLPPAPWEKLKTDSIKTKKAPVMWVDFDNGQDMTHRRISAFAHTRNLPDNTPFYYYSMPMPFLDASSYQSIGMLELRAITKGAKLIVIDNLGTISGGVDENSGQMIAVMSNLRRLAEDTGAAVILIHHQTKGVQQGGRAGDRLRGHGSIEAALNLALLVEREEQSETITLKSTKTRGVDVYPFSAYFSYTHNLNGDLETGQFYGLVTEDNKSSKAIEREVITALTGFTMNKKDLAIAVQKALPDIGINRIRNIINKMANEKKIKTRQGNKTEVLYFL